MDEDFSTFANDFDGMALFLPSKTRANVLMY